MVGGSGKAAAQRLGAARLVRGCPREPNGSNSLDNHDLRPAAQSCEDHSAGGEQKVTVQHVTVSDNAQAIVGNVSTGGGDDGKK